MSIDPAALVASVATLGKALPHRILLVDDDDLELELLAGRMNSAGFEVTCAKNGEQALAIFQQQWFPIVLTDWNMPLMDGLILTEQLRARARDEVYIIMLSGRDDSAAYERGYHAGVDDYLSKQLTDPELLSRIEAGFRTLVLRRSLKQARAALENARTTDVDSEAYSAPHLLKQLNSEIKRSKRYGRNLSILVLCAHRMHDPADPAPASKSSGLAPPLLQSIVRTLDGSIRTHIDWIARYRSEGGESVEDGFAIVLPETGPAEAAVVRQRIRAVCERLTMGAPGPLGSVDFTVGAASLNVQDAKGTLAAADFLRVARLSCDCSAAPENHLRAVQASVEVGVLIPCRIGYAVSPNCRGE